MPRPVALLTDFGTADPYAGVLRGVILTLLPGAVLFDLTHEIPPQDVRAGALHLAAAAPFCPPDAVFLAVVDPGVGGERPPLMLRARQQLFVGPDNGLLWAAAARDGRPEAWRPDLRHGFGELSATFHGRDLFAPLAARLAGGAAPESLGPPVADPVEWAPPPPTWTADGLAGEVLLVDRYGNAITNLRPADCGDPAAGSLVFTAGAATLAGPGSHYGSVPPGEPVVVRGSLGTYEIAVNLGRAADAFGLAAGVPVFVRPRGA